MATLTREHDVCHECAYILTYGDGDPDRLDIVGAWCERELSPGEHAVMACDHEGGEHSVSYVLPCDICREVGSPFGLHPIAILGPDPCVWCGQTGHDSADFASCPWTPGHDHR
jgi:hypothetical protein